MQPVYQVGLFLVQVLFDTYIFFLLLRFVLQYLRVDYYNPVTQFIVKITSPVIKPLRRIIPGFWGIDFATLVVIIALVLIKGCLIILLQQKAITPINLGLFAVNDLVMLVINLYLYSILIMVVLSWVSQAPHYLTQILTSLTNPVLRPVRKVVPIISGFDLSPMLVMIILVSIKILWVGYLKSIGLYVAAI